jgi:hypothetical protein
MDFDLVQVPDKPRYTKGDFRMENQLSIAINRLAQETHGVGDKDLERAWAWGSYDSEGIRFAFFRTFEQLRQLAVELGQARTRRELAISEAQHVLAQYHAAYRDLDAALLGVGSDFFHQEPAEGEWPLRRVIAHIVSADLGFYVVIRYALKRYRDNPDLPEEIPDEAWEPIMGMDEDAYRTLVDGPVENLREYHTGLHQRILTEFAGIRENELGVLSRYWEKEPMSLRFRLHRFESHMRQHTIQVDKTLEELGLPPNEAKRLLRLIYAALAEVEGTKIGAGEFGQDEMTTLAEQINERTDEIVGI